MELSDERRGQIALAYLKQLFRKNGIELRGKEQMIREMKNIAKAINVPEEEAIKFAEEIIRGMVDEIFSSNKQKS
jgi:hypothetical protein